MRERILNYIIEFGSINTKQAFIDLGCSRLSEYIRQLRKEYNIKDVWVESLNRWGEPTHYKEYYLDEENKSIK